MEFQRLAPGVQDHQPADLRSQAPRGRGDFQQRLPHGAKQERVEPGRMGGRHGGQLVRDAEDHVEVFDGQQFCGALFEPGGPFTPLAFRTVPVAARVVQRSLDAAGVAAVEMASHAGRPAARQRRQHQPLPRSQAGSAGAEEGVSVTADDFADFERGPLFRCPGAGTGACRNCSRGSSSRDRQASCRWLRRTWV